MNTKVTYDPVQKLWMGPKTEYLYGTQSVAEVLYKEMYKDLDHVCQISDDSGEIYTNERLLKAAISIANGLKKLGIKKGDVILVHMHNHHYLLPTWLGVIFSGAVLCPFHFTYTAITDELPDIIKRINPKIMFSSYHEMVELMKSTFNENNIDCPIYIYENKMEGCHDLKPLLENHFVSFNEFTPPSTSDPANDVFVLVLTSATTGTAKLINCVQKQLFTQFSENMQRKTFATTALPGWQSEFNFSMGALAHHCCRIIRVEHAMDNFLRLLEKYECTFCFLKPKEIFDMLKTETIKKVDLSKLNVVICGGHHLSAKLHRQFQEYIPHGQVLSQYGCSEFGGVAEGSNLDPDTPHLVGRVKRNFLYGVLDDAGNRLGPNEVGELCFTSSAPFAGYYNDKEGTKAALTADGFFLSGDRGYLDEDGNIFLLERRKFAISYRGKLLDQWDVEKIILENVNPKAIEGVCVLDIESDEHGMMPIIAIVPGKELKITEAEIIKTVMEHHPFEFETKVFFFDELPTTISGKYKKYLVREMIMKKMAEIQ